MKHRQSRFVLIVCLLLSALIVAGCSESPQEKYKDATSKLAEAKKARQKAKDKVADAKDKVQQAQKNLDKAQDKLQDARQKVIAATQAVNKTVSDEVLFRTLQRSLLDKDKFGQSAISVGVHNRVVTLTGTVPDQEMHKKALKTVHNQAGVADVKDRLEVASNKDGASQSDNANSNDGAAQKPEHDQKPNSGSNSAQKKQGGQGNNQPQNDQPG